MLLLHQTGDYKISIPRSIYDAEYITESEFEKIHIESTNPPVISFLITEHHDEFNVINPDVYRCFAQAGGDDD